MTEAPIPEFDRLHMDDVIAGRADISESEQIEDALMVIKAAQKKVEFLRRLKARRAAALDAEVKHQEARVEQLKQAIAKCMIAKKDKTLDFPDVAKVSIRKVKGTWTVLDEEKLVDHLEKLDKFDEVGEKVIKINKTKLNKVLNELEANHNTSKAVVREEDRESLTVTFHELYVPEESIDDLLPPPLPKPVIPETIKLVPTRQFDTSDEGFRISGLEF